MDESLVQQIRDAFTAGTPPARPITGHRCDECDEADQLLGGRTWVDVANDFPIQCHDVMPLLQPEAKVYYLPAYMTFEIRSGGGWLCGLSVRMGLLRGDFPPESFTPVQRAVILRWLANYIQDSGDGNLSDLEAIGWQDKS